MGFLAILHWYASVTFCLDPALGAARFMGPIRSHYMLFHYVRYAVRPWVHAPLCRPNCGISFRHAPEGNEAASEFCVVRQACRIVHDSRYSFLLPFLRHYPGFD